MDSKFSIEKITDDFILIKDLANSFQTKTITNDVENVVKHLHKQFGLQDRHLYYIDTDGQVDLIIHNDEGDYLYTVYAYKNLEEMEIAFG